MALALAMFALGLVSWSLAEYAIHGWMSHVFDTFAKRFHAAHHRDPHAVFTVGAWIPLALVSTAICAGFGAAPGAIAWLGFAAGFVGYELLHYRLHFSKPLCALEERLRRRHLAHHLRAPAQCFGVTNRLWDRVFGSEPGRARMAELEASVAGVRPLGGASNFRLIFRPWFFLSR